MIVDINHSKPAMRAEIQTKRNKAFLVGDSLSVGSKNTIQAGLPGKIKVDAKVSRTTKTGISILKQSRSAKKANTWIVALGTNDAPNKTIVKKNVKTVLQLAKKYKVKNVIWLTIVRPGGYNKTNRLLKTLDKKHAQLTVLDWANVVQKRKKLVRSDRVHYTAYGYKIRGKHIVSLTKKIWKTKA